MRARAFARSTDRWKPCGQPRDGWLASELVTPTEEPSLEAPSSAPLGIRSVGLFRSKGPFLAEGRVTLVAGANQVNFFFLLRSVDRTCARGTFFVEGRGTLVAGAFQVNLFFFSEAPPGLPSDRRSSSKGPSTLFAEATQVNTVPFVVLRPVASREVPLGVCLRGGRDIVPSGLFRGDLPKGEPVRALRRRGR